MEIKVGIQARLVQEMDVGDITPHIPLLITPLPEVLLDILLLQKPLCTVVVDPAFGHNLAGIILLQQDTVVMVIAVMVTVLMVLAVAVPLTDREMAGLRPVTAVPAA